jgi:hypothetical protein
VAEIKETLRIQDLNLDEVNRIMGRLQDRLDALEGYRGTPAFYADVDMQKKYLTNVAGMSTETTSDMTMSGTTTFNGNTNFTNPPTFPILTTAPNIVNLPNSGDMAIYKISAYSIKIAVNVNGTIWFASLTI